MKCIIVDELERLRDIELAEQREKRQKAAEEKAGVKKKEGEEAKEDNKVVINKVATPMIRFLNLNSSSDTYDSIPF